MEVVKTDIKYTTHHLGYAGYLSYMGFNCVAVIPSEKKPGYYDFAFDWIGDVKSYETSFFSDGAIVEPREYVRKIAKLRDMLNEKKNLDLVKNVPLYK